MNRTLTMMLGKMFGGAPAHAHRQVFPFALVAGSGSLQILQSILDSELNPSQA